MKYTRGKSSSPLIAIRHTIARGDRIQRRAAFVILRLAPNFVGPLLNRYRANQSFFSRLNLVLRKLTLRIASYSIHHHAHFRIEPRLTVAVFGTVSSLSKRT